MTPPSRKVRPHPGATARPHSGAAAGGRSRGAVTSSGGDRGRLVRGDREAGVRVVRGGSEDHAQHPTVLVDQRPAGVTTADERADRIDLPGHLAPVVDVRTRDVADIAY